MVQLHLNGIQMGHVIWQLAYCLHIAAAEKSPLPHLLHFLRSCLFVVSAPFGTFHLPYMCREGKGSQYSDMLPNINSLK